jgi:hypothetical protein
METIYPGTTNMVELTRLRNRLTGLYPVDATVVASLITTAEAAITGATNLAVTYVADTEDEETQYVGAIPSTVTLAYNTRYILRVTATVGSVVRRFDIGCKTPPLPT